MATNAHNFDFDASIEAIDGDTELFGKLVDAFQHEAQSLRDRLTDGLAADDLPKIRRAAHSLMGPLQLFSAIELSKTAQNLEQACVSENRELVTSSVQQLELGVVKLQESLQTYQEQNASS